MSTQNKKWFISLLLILFVAICTCVAEPVSATQVMSISLPNNAHTRQETTYTPQSVVILDKNIYLPLVARYWPPLPHTPILNATTDETFAISLTWHETITTTPVSYYIIQEASTTDFATSKSYTTTTQTLILADKPYGTYYYRVQGYNSWGNSMWSNVEMLNIENPPLLNITTSDFFTANLTWQDPITRTPIAYYTIQEADNAAFTNSSNYTMTEQALTLPNKPRGTYYYRVQGHSHLWGDSGWSNTGTAKIQTLLDDFNNPATGWRAHRTSYSSLNLMVANYTNDNLETFVQDKFDFAIFSPLQDAPELPYTIKLKTKIRHRVNLVSYGIVWGGNQGTFCNVVRDTAMNPNGCFSHYYRLNVVWAGNYLKFNVNRINSHDDRGRGLGTQLLDYYNLTDEIPDFAGWHHWEIKVTETGFAIYVNNHHITTINDSDYSNNPYYGIFSSTNEYNNAHFEHDYFYIYPETEGNPSNTTSNTAQ